MSLEFETIVTVNKDATLFGENFRIVNAKTINPGTSEIICQSVGILWLGTTSSRPSLRSLDKDYLDRIYKDAALLPAEKRDVIFEVIKESIILASDTILILGKTCFNPYTSKSVKNKREAAVTHIRAVTDVYIKHHKLNSSSDLIICGQRSFSVPILSRTYEFSSHRDLPFFSFTRRHFFRRSSK